MYLRTSIRVLLVVFLFSAIVIIISINEESTIITDNKISVNLIANHSDSTKCTYYKRKSNKNNSLFKCQLPSIDPCDPTILQYLDKTYNPLGNCQTKFAPRSELKNGQLRVCNRLKKGEATKYRCFNVFRDYISYTKWIAFDRSAIIDCDCEFVDVRYEIRKRFALFPLATYSYLHWHLSDRCILSKLPSNGTSTTIYQPDVLMIVLDSTSMSNARRSLQKTLHFFEQNYSAIAFDYFNKIGKNSYPNSHAMITGIRTEPISSAEADQPDYDNICDTYLDDKDSVFKFYNKSNYVSTFAYDYTKMEFFTYPKCYGFKNRPTTHNYRPLTYRLLLDSSYQRSMLVDSCKESHDYILDYTQEFFQIYANRSKFVISWLHDLVHENVNGLYHADDYLYKYLQRNIDRFANSFIFLIADHGKHFGPITQTNIGNMENNNPMLFVAVPRRFRSNLQLMNNLQRNSRQLVTPYDIYMTLYDISNNKDWQNVGKQSFDGLMVSNRGESLIRSFVRSPRTCQSLEIPEQYCLCEQTYRSININNPFAYFLAHTLVAYINNRLVENEVQHVCERLSLYRIINVRLPNDGKLAIVRFETIPGNGIYEGHIVFANQSNFNYLEQNYNSYVKNVHFMIRLDEYGSSVNCVHDYNIVHYCYCMQTVLKRFLSYFI